MITTTDTGADLLRAIAENPDEDTPRLMYADFLDENATCEADRARAELIRVQVDHWRFMNMVKMTESQGHRMAWLYSRAAELVRLHETAWRSTGPLSEMYGVPYRDGAGDIQKRWKHAVTFVRGFPVVRCRLDEIGAEREREFTNGADFPSRWTPTPWAVECVRIGASFEVTNREPGDGNHRPERLRFYQRGADGVDRGNLPGVVFDELIGHEEVTFREQVPQKRWTHAADADRSLNAAVHRLVVREAYKEGQA